LFLSAFNFGVKKFEVIRKNKPGEAVVVGVVEEDYGG